MNMIKTTVNFQYTYHIATRDIEKSTNTVLQGDKKTLFSTHLTLVPLVKKISRHVNHEDFSEKLNIGAYPYKADFEDF